MRIVFLLNDLRLSGGVGVVIEHARRLSARHGHDVTLAVLGEGESDRRWAHFRFDGLAVRAFEEIGGDRFEIAVATWWDTVYRLWEIDAARYVHFVQSLEDRFYPQDAHSRFAAGVPLTLPLAYITEARCIADVLAGIRPDARCLYVRNGIDKSQFDRLPAPTPALDGPLRIVIEGHRDVWFKGVDDAVAAVAAMREPHHVTYVNSGGAPVEGLPVDRVVGPLSQAEFARVLAESHVLLKLSRVEGMFGPPLEGFHAGATCVVAPVTGHDEYVEHGVNGLVVEWDDPVGQAVTLDRLARDRRLLHRLRCGAVLTARGWPSWDQASEFMAAALEAIAAEEFGTSEWTPRALLPHLRGLLQQRASSEHALKVEVARLTAETERLAGDAIWWQHHYEQAVASRPYQVGTALQRVARHPLVASLRRTRRG